MNLRIPRVCQFNEKIAFTIPVHKGSSLKLPAHRIVMQYPSVPTRSDGMNQVHVTWNKEHVFFKHVYIKFTSFWDIICIRNSCTIHIKTILGLPIPILASSPKAPPDTRTLQRATTWWQQREGRVHLHPLYSYPIGSMYGIFTCIYHKNQPNVGKYTIHGSYGYYKLIYNVLSAIFCC